MELIAVFFIPVSLVIADCNNPPTPIPNASHNLTSPAPYSTGIVAHFECNAGYNPTGTSKNYRCSDSGSWVDGYLVCEERFCTYIPPPENGRIVNEQTRQIGSAIIFQCNTGYTRSGPDQMTCRADSLWSPNTPPTCRINMCPEFGSIQYAVTFQDNSYTVRNGYGSIVKVTCNYGYIISGSPNVMCQADGTWGSRPVCQVSTCPPYTGLNSSCIERTQLVLNNNYLLIVCKVGDDVSVTRTGPDAVECKNQQWDMSQGTINCFCDCKIEGLEPAWISISNLNGNGFLNYNEALHWNCLNNARKAATSAPVCREQRINVSELCIKPFRTTEVPPITDSDGSTVYPPTTKPEKQETGSDKWIVLGVVISVFVILAVAVAVIFCWKKISILVVIEFCCCKKHHNTNNSSSGDKFNPEYKNGRHGDGSPHEPEKVDLLNKPT